MYCNRHSGTWNKEACNLLGRNHRCVKMDCHKSTTHWKLLGIFKEAQYGDWLGFLLQYQGDCVWTDDEYTFMQAISSVKDEDGMQQQLQQPWPEECTAVEDHDGFVIRDDPQFDWCYRISCLSWITRYCHTSQGQFLDKCCQCRFGSAIDVLYLHFILLPLLPQSLKRWVGPPTYICC